MNVSEIISLNTTKKSKIIMLLELGMTRLEIANLEILGAYGAIQNVYAAWKQGAAATPPRATRFIPTIFNKKFGIEIEAFGVEIEKLVEKLNEAGIDAQTENYGHTTRTYWKVTTDSSIDARGLPSFEIVSPILEGENGLQQLEKICNVLTNLRAKINKTCGLHVHFDAQTMTATQAKNIVLNYISLEHTIDSMMPVSRRANNSQYCASMHYYRNEFQQCNTIYELSLVMPNRYRKINLECYRRQGTIEFRQHSGTVEFPKMKNWLIFLHNLTDFSKNHRINSDSFQEIEKFNQTETIEFYHNRINDLAA